MIGADFTAAAVLITFGAVLGRASPFQMIIIAFMECIFYSANEALNINVIKAADAGGSMIIHTFGAYFGLAVSVILYRKKATDHPRNSNSYHSDLFAMIGKASCLLCLSLCVSLCVPEYVHLHMSVYGMYMCVTMHGFHCSKISKHQGTLSLDIIVIYPCQLLHIIIILCRWQFLMAFVFCG